MKKSLIAISFLLAFSFMPHSIIAQSSEDPLKENLGLFQHNQDPQNNNYLGTLSSSPYSPDSVSNPYGPYGNRYGNTVKNPYSYHGRHLNNPYASDSNSPMIIGEDGKYLGRLNSNRYGSDSIANPYGRYGSRYSPDSVNNPYGKYGSRYSPYSANNPYASSPPKIVEPQSSPSYISPGYGLPLFPKLPE